MPHQNDRCGNDGLDDQVKFAQDHGGTVVHPAAGSLDDPEQGPAHQQADQEHGQGGDDQPGAGAAASQVAHQAVRFAGAQQGIQGEAHAGQQVEWIDQHKDWNSAQADHLGHANLGQRGRQEGDTEGWQGIGNQEQANGEQGQQGGGDQARSLAAVDGRMRVFPVGGIP